MDINTAIASINYLLIHSHSRNQRLNELEEEIIRGCWMGKYYKEIAKESKHTNDQSYISNRASELWNQLSEALGEKVRRKSLKTALNNWYQNYGQDLLDQSNFPVVEENHFSNFLQNPSYVYREEEEVCYQALLRAKSCLRLKGLTQVGKTLLIQRVMARLKINKNYNYVYLSLKEVENYRLDNTEELMRWFSQKIATEINSDNQVEEYFPSDKLGPIVQCTAYFEDYILEALDSPLVLCIDDIHLLLPHETITDSFFRMLRSWLEKEDLVWRQKFRLAIVYTTDIYTSTSINRSPLNMGLVVELSEFNNEEVTALVKTYKTLKPSQFDQRGIKPLTELVNNNPYLLKIKLRI
jgi:chromosomal replication initiation ATPase DnaA